MAKKSTENLSETFEAEVQTTSVETAETKTATAVEGIATESRIWVYYGPSIRGVVTNGRIFRGTRAEVLKSLEAAIAKYPQIERLIVADKEIKKARADMKSKRGIYIQYEALVKLLENREV